MCVDFTLNGLTLIIFIYYYLHLLFIYYSHIKWCTPKRCGFQTSWKRDRTEPRNHLHPYSHMKSKLAVSFWKLIFYCVTEMLKYTYIYSNINFMVTFLVSSHCSVAIGILLIQVNKWAWTNEHYLKFFLPVLFSDIITGDPVTLKNVKAGISCPREHSVSVSEIYSQFIIKNGIWLCPLISVKN